MAKAQIQELDKMQREDHDLLIRLESKVDSLIVDVKDMKDGISQRLADHDTRLRAMEKIMEDVNPNLRVKQHDELWQWRHDFQLTWKIVIGIAAFIGSLVSFIIYLIFNILKLFR